MTAPSEITEHLQQADDAFEYIGLGTPAFEEGIDQDAEWKIQLTKACRYLESARVLRAEDGFHGAVVELSFSSTERTIEAYLLWDTDDTIENFHDHEAAYDRAAERGLFDRSTASDLKGLYSDNRTGHYYGVQVPTKQKSDATYALAESIHQYVTQQIRDGSVCICEK
ncbi:DNA-binding protein [Halovivax gelatinilyticus]|uniref:DNA-binding protein n=1 Tax=Halovivax gelatinilyticus TaxID=2961597 RepID=UPI0020CA5D14|nr:DNA-binding protein [Halovivax gelatinilyticus]